MSLFLHSACTVIARRLISTRHFLAARAASPYYFDSNCCRFDGDAAVRDGIPIEVALASVISHLAGSPAGFTFITTPSSSPADLGERLVRDHGLAIEGDFVVMAVRVSDLKACPPPPPEYELREVLTAADYKAYARAFCEGFSLAADIIDEEVRYLEVNIGLSHYPALRQFGAWHGGRIVATSSSWTHAGVAGVYCVSTLPEHRGRGLGAAMTHLAALAGAPLSGVAVLQATTMGAPVYRRLGFQDVAEYTVYRSPVSPPRPALPHRVAEAPPE